MKKHTAIKFLLCCIALLCFVSTASPQTIWKDNKLYVDSSNIENATIEASILNPDPLLRYKLMVVHEEETYYYDLYPEETAVIPLQMGHGAYKLQLYEQVHDTIYDQAGKTKLYLSTENENKVWLQPNVRVNYTAYKDRLLEELRKMDLSNNSEKEKFEKISFVTRNHYAYDYIAPYSERLPTHVDFDFVLTNHIGSCEEMAALTVAFCRLEGIPATLVIGKANGKTHAWVKAFIDEAMVEVFDPSTTESRQEKTTYIPERYY
ncbi:transglutaminase domain-containing protein [Candidatus Saccharibacteria bacterium]|nr:transglutaminase domain-containing protein [Candidatus Saccharibacteria bacterium]